MIVGNIGQGKIYQSRRKRKRKKRKRRRRRSEKKRRRKGKMRMRVFKGGSFRHIRSTGGKGRGVGWGS